MWGAITKAFTKKRLKDERYSVLFGTPPHDEWVAFDCETTGLDVKKDQIVSIGAVKIRGNAVMTSETLELFVKPSGTVSEESIKVHHIRNADLQGALEPKEAIERFVDFVGARALVGYYLEFDVGMIDKLLRNFAGVGLPNAQVEVSSLYYDRKNDVFGGKYIDLRFESIIKDMELPSMARHSALSDAVMTALIFVKLKSI